MRHQRPGISRENLENAYAIARAACEAAGPPIGRGHRVFCVEEKRVEWIDLKVGEHAVFGTHDACDIELPDAPWLMTRHAFALSHELADGTLALRLLDLHTGIPFFLQDDEPHVSLVVGGPFAVRLDRFIVGAFPFDAIGPANDRSAPIALPDVPITFAAHSPMSRPSESAGFVSSLPPPAPVSAYPGRASEPAVSPATIRSDVPMIIRSDMPGTSYIRPADSQGVEALNTAPPKRVRLTVRRGARAASVELMESALDLGLLIGRAANCEDGGLREVLDERVSRVHLLILSGHDSITAYDVCSRNGTRVDDQRVRSVELTDAGLTATLGHDLQLDWHPRTVVH